MGSDRKKGTEMGRLNLTGKTVETEGRWGFEVTLESENGKASTQSSQYVFETQEEAANHLRSTIESVLSQLSDQGVHVLGGHEGYQQ